MIRLLRSVSLLVVFGLSACATASSNGLVNSICELDLSSLRPGTELRVSAIYSPSSMHGDVLYDTGCQVKRLMTYGYDQAKGQASEGFRKEMMMNAIHADSLEYIIDVAGVIERDEDGLWLKAITVFSYRKKEGVGLEGPGP